MKFLYAPWRSHYTDSTERAKESGEAVQDCVFCTNLQKNDDASCFILKRYKHNFVIMNRFPYNAGHLLILPLEHIGHLEHLSKEARAEMMELSILCTKIMETAGRPHGFNIGFNLGKASGGTIPTHVHMHILPRWIGDTNFLMTLDNTKVISTDLVRLYNDLKPHFDKQTLT